MMIVLSKQCMFCIISESSKGERNSMGVAGNSSPQIVACLLRWTFCGITRAFHHLNNEDGCRADIYFFSWNLNLDWLDQNFGRPSFPIDPISRANGESYFSWWRCLSYFYKAVQKRKGVCLSGEVGILQGPSSPPARWTNCRCSRSRASWSCSWPECCPSSWTSAAPTLASRSLWPWSSCTCPTYWPSSPRSLSLGSLKSSMFQGSLPRSQGQVLLMRKVFARLWFRQAVPCKHKSGTRLHFYE